ncbi:MAG: sensor histidine kinase [Bacillota bacterium]
MWNNASLKQRVLIVNTVSLIVMVVLMSGLFMLTVNNLFGYEAYMDASGLDASSAERETIRTFLNDAQSTFYLIALGIIVLFALLGFFGFKVMTRKALEPLDILARRMDGIDPENLPKAIELPSESPEVRRVETAFNRMIEKIQTTLESQKRFARHAAHELKTPLSAVMTNLEVLNMDEAPSKEDYREVLDIANDHMERMHTLVKELLEMHVSKLEKSHFHLRDMTLMDERMHRLAEDRKIKVELKGDCELHVNKPLFEKALQNLVHNALLYGRESGSVRIVAASGKITVSDDGPGIKADHLDKIFEPFYRVEPSRSKAYGGNGLGLAIVKEIIDRHGMKIQVESAPEKGTTFTITW